MDLRRELLQALADEGPIDVLIFKLACGKFTSSPFSEDLLQRGRAILLRGLAKDGADDPELAVAADGQPFLLRMMTALGERIGDPDVRVLTQGADSFAEGVPIGVGLGLPRTPAVFERKVQWRRLDDTVFSKDCANYSSAEAAADTLERQFQEEAGMGMMVEMSEVEAASLYPGDRLRIASLGAIEKDDDTFRVVHDATHGVRVNCESRQRDQVRMPGAPDARRIIQHAADLGGVHFMLKADISKAHRRVKVRRGDWGLQACRVRSRRVWLNRVGTFGVGTAGYWWQRLASVVARIAWAFVLPAEEIWQLVYADDLLWSASGPRKFDNLALMLFVWALLGAPFSWRKCRGGLALDWIGYWLDYERFAMGISDKRAAVIIEFLKGVLASETTLVRRFAEGLGRLGFAMGVLEWQRPFLAPLYSWAASLPMSAYVPIPVAVKLSVEYLLDRLEAGHLTTPCPPLDTDIGEIFRADARAEDDFAVLGGYETAGGIEKGKARWYSLTVRREDAPEFFLRGTAQRVVAAWELAATLFSVHLFAPKAQAKGLGTCSGITDNLGNSFVVAKCQSTKFPVNVVLMELATVLESRGLWLDLAWKSRDLNTEADALTNWDFTGFDPLLRMEVKWDMKTFPILEKFLAAGASLYAGLEESKRARAEARGGRAKRGRGGARAASAEAEDVTPNPGREVGAVFQ